MKPLQDKKTRTLLKQRIALLSENHESKWGKMNCAQAIVHMAGQLKIALGDLQLKPVPGIGRYFPFRPIIINWMPWPKGLPTAKELELPKTNNWVDDVKLLEQLMDRFAEPANSNSTFEPHPFFGTLTHTSWGILAARHINHHLKQFGV